MTEALIVGVDVPEPSKGSCEAEAALRVGPAEPIESSAEVVVLALEPLGPLALVLEPLGVGPLGELLEEGCMVEKMTPGGDPQSGRNIVGICGGHYGGYAVPVA